MNWLLSPLGLTIESQAEEYSRRLKDDRSGLKEWNAGDMLRDVFTPGTREDLEEAARKLETGRLNSLSTKDREIIKQTLGNTSMTLTDQSLKIGETEKAEDYDARLAGLKATGTANVNNIGIEDYDPSKVIDGMTSTGVMQLGTAQKATNKETAEQKIQDELERREGREDNKYNLERLDQNQLLMLQQQNLMADREDRRLDRQMENRLNERRLDMQEARDFRKDRQMAIMQIVKGLQGMGNAFSF